MSADAITAGLNPEQSAAVQTTEGPLLVLAGAGSGKTRVLTHRIAWLIGACGIAPEAILAVTFTNKAAGEMRDRVEKLLGPEARDVWVGTFHATCVRILRREIGHLGRSRGFVIYDDGDTLAMVKEALRRNDLDPKTHDPRRLRWRIDQMKNAGWLPADAARRAEDIDAELAAKIYATYQRLLGEANALDFNDLLLQTSELFERFPEVLRHYQERWQYVMVDEYQDTNKVQYKLVNQLAAAHRNLCVVGDPDQSVYGWRGADIRNILDFERDFTDTQVVKLERNYRSTQPILSGAGSVVSNNRDRPPKEMIAERGAGEKIRLYEARNERDEAQHVVGGILEGVRGEGRPWSHFAIFYRTNAQSRPIEEELLKYDVPYVVVGGVRFYDRAEVKDVLAWLRLLVNPADGMALRRVLGAPPRGIGKTTLARAQELAAADGASLLEGLRRVAQTGTAARGRARIRELFALLESLGAEVLHRTPAEAISAVLERSGYLRSLETEGTPEAESRLENLRELVAGAEDFGVANEGEDDGERTAIELFLDQVALVTDLDKVDDRSDRVSLMTVHSAKGLEFPVVALVGMEEGIFPHSASARDDRSVEEERRLCYVGMTRAMERLTLAWARERRRYGSLTWGAPSRFLQEIQDEFVEGSSPTARHHAGPAPTAPRRSEGRSLDYSYGQSSASVDHTGLVGRRVRHPIFGSGAILEAIGNGQSQKLRIRFDRAGVKTVLVRYANLEFG